MPQIAALYVQKNGAYFNLPDVDPWDESRDARLYGGPHPVVAHPPCARWCRLAGLVEKRWGLKRAEDGGTFAAALDAVRRFGGVLEHPAWSLAWPAHGLTNPLPEGWIRTFDGGWVCQIEQGHYGHRARKATWLLVYGARQLPSLRWGPATAKAWVGWTNNRSHGKVVKRTGKKERSATPDEFKRLLISIAQNCISEALV